MRSMSTPMIPTRESTLSTAPSPASSPTPSDVNHENAFHKEVYTHIAPYAQSQDLRAWFEFILTSVIYVSLWIFPPTYMFKYLFILAGMVKIRLFVLFHDMGHLNFFTDPGTNKFVGTLLSGVIYTPYSYWTKGHNYHHKNSNNLDKHQYAQTSPWTTSAFQKAAFWQKMLYTFVFGPLTLWTFIPITYFMVVQRLFANWIENFLSLCCFAFPLYLGREYFMYEMSMNVVSSIGGFFLFHVQHTFKGCYKRRAANWDYFDNGMQGASLFEVPYLLKWVTFGIEYHHIHHLNSRVPGYRLKECHDASGHLFDSIPRITLWQAIESLPYSLYDEYGGYFDNVYDEFKSTPKIITKKE